MAFFMTCACQDHHIKSVKVLLDNKVDNNKCDGNGATALYIACQNNQKKIVKLLLDNKEDIDACDGIGDHLYIACQKSHIELVKSYWKIRQIANGASHFNVYSQNNHIASKDVTGQ